MLWNDSGTKCNPSTKMAPRTQVVKDSTVPFHLSLNQLPSPTHIIKPCLSGSSGYWNLLCVWRFSLPFPRDRIRGHHRRNAEDVNTNTLKLKTLSLLYQGVHYPNNTGQAQLGTQVKSTLWWLEHKEAYSCSHPSVSWNLSTYIYRKLYMRTKSLAYPVFYPSRFSSIFPLNFSVTKVFIQQISASITERQM